MPIKLKLEKKCVTLEGDVFDPSGTLTGGYFSSGNCILNKYEEFKKIRNNVENYEKELRICDEKITKIQKEINYIDSLKADYENKSYKLQMINENQKKKGINLKEKYESI